MVSIGRISRWAKNRRIDRSDHKIALEIPELPMSSLPRRGVKILVSKGEMYENNHSKGKVDAIPIPSQLLVPNSWNSMIL